MSFADPFGGWGELARKSAEMIAASAVVIPYRTSRPNTPSQIMEMGGEKVEASLEAWQAMASQWLRMSSAARAPSLTQWAALWTSGVRPFHRRAVANSRKVHRSA